jgi:Putative beta-barrel porin 2
MRTNSKLLLMKINLGCFFALAGSCAGLIPCSSSAQEFFRDFGTSRSSGGFGPVVPSEYSYQESSPSGLSPLRPGQELSYVEEAEEADRYNFAIGPVHFGLAMGVGLEWNDNIFLSDENREADFVFRPVLDLQASWRISQLNTLKLSIGAAYAKYFDHSELDTDGILLSPNTELALTFIAGQVKFTIRDRVSYQEDTYDLPTLSGAPTYGRWENQAGIVADWAMNPWVTLSAGFDHYNLWSKNDQFDSQDRAVDTVFVKPSFQITPSVKVGLNAAYSWIDFERADRADGDNTMIGPFIEWQVSEFTNLYLEAGYQSLNFDGGSDLNNPAIDELNLSDEDAAAVRDILRDTEDSDSFYVKFEINNRPTPFYTHRLSGSKTSEIGFGSNYYDLYHIEYNADWMLAAGKIELGPTLFYEYYETSGQGAEKADRIGAAVGLRYHFSNSLTLGLDYRYIWKDSDLQGADYYQNLAFLSLYYKF